MPWRTANSVVFGGARRRRSERCFERGHTPVGRSISGGPRGSIRPSCDLYDRDSLGEAGNCACRPAQRSGRCHHLHRRCPVRQGSLLGLRFAPFPRSAFGRPVTHLVIRNRHGIRSPIRELATMLQGSIPSRSAQVLGPSIAANEKFWNFCGHVVGSVSPSTDRKKYP
jgi:hypothetical protein